MTTTKSIITPIKHLRSRKWLQAHLYFLFTFIVASFQWKFPPLEIDSSLKKKWKCEVHVFQDINFLRRVYWITWIAQNVFVELKPWVSGCPRIKYYNTVRRSLARRAACAKAISSEHRHCLDKQSIPICAAVVDAANRPIYKFLRLT